MRRTRIPNGVDHSLRLPLAVSAAGHLVLLAVLLFGAQLRGANTMAPPAIQVRMVTLKPQNTAAVTTPSPTKAAPAKKAVASKPPAAKPKAAVATGKPRKKAPVVKRALKRKTYQPKKVLNQAIEQIKQQVESRIPQTLADSLRKLQQKVDAGPKPPPASATQAGRVPADTTQKISGQGTKAADLITLYRIEIAFQVQKNWAFNPQLAGGQEGLMTSLFFKVLPDGQIRDITITERSGNRYLDESAYKAVVKSNPVKPHPAGVDRPFVTVGLRFTPQGVR